MDFNRFLRCAMLRIASVEMTRVGALRIASVEMTRVGALRIASVEMTGKNIEHRTANIEL
jgi:hypothetical protein